ncbi:MAG: alpha/beta fold hydrolase [Gemmatimonadetes bacterium]|nr:alpha/beta fold hydrolase [Gemmatimonadota bacterium]NNM04171.1 alpha/beta fold hydrolase [Gemmatimonadota bacterium]
MYSSRFRGSRSLVLLAMVMVPTVLHGQETPLAADRWNRAAMEWIGLLESGAFEEASSRVDPAVPEGAMSTDQLKTIWAQLTAQVGALQSLQPGAVTETGVYHIVRLPAEFLQSPLIIQITLTASLQVSGLFFLPSEPPPYDPPPYVREDAFEEVEVNVGTEPWILPGVLSLPRAEGPVPAVVLVHGSGPNDRDETIGGSRPFRDLAWGLASRGIGVLRYDKRTRVHGAKISADIGLEEEVIQDALEALALVRARPEVDPDRVILLGHSLGGIMAPEIARQDGELAGVVILAAPARPFFEVLKSQLEYIGSLEADPESPARAQLDSLISVVHQVESGEIPDDQSVLGAPPPYWREVAAVDPVAVAAGLSTPLFVLQGGRDYQATSEDLAIWVEKLGEQANFTARLYPDLNHLFGPGTGTATPEEYVTGVNHVAEEVISDLREWILGVGR